MGPSRSQAKRAGALLKRFRRGDYGPVAEMDDETVRRLLDAYGTVQGWRDSYAAPLNSVRMSLTSFVRTTGVDSFPPAQRHKRVPRIVAKLARPGATGQLDTMHDIGGCRVVLKSIDDLRKLEGHIRMRCASQILGDPDRFDYITSPQPSGYRGKHIVIRRQDRLIEVQLRTESQHEWADWVETTGRRLSFELKSGEGPPELLHFCQVTADMMACEAAGETPSADLVDAWGKARSNAIPYFGA